MNLEPMHEPKSATQHRPGCLWLIVQSYGLCFVFTIAASLVLQMVKGVQRGRIEDGPPAVMFLLTFVPPLAMWFPIVCYFWSRGNRVAWVVGAVVGSAVGTVIIRNWLEEMIASAG